ncbi:hypothetical protein PIB30_069066 [Stylosanthes scabra]|uniref:Uncharacterized protein n=1 Tax=Stylosanthes scabra TaxID=79078 RepID=A0ABU6TQF4_9FABA|nr:hypothetical protein [Stylosanthes scabra]
MCTEEREGRDAKRKEVPSPLQIRSATTAVACSVVAEAFHRWGLLPRERTRWWWLLVVTAVELPAAGAISRSRRASCRRGEGKHEEGEKEQVLKEKEQGASLELLHRRCRRVLHG